MTKWICKPQAIIINQIVIINYCNLSRRVESTRNAINNHDRLALDMAMNFCVRSLGYQCMILSSSFRCFTGKERIFFEVAKALQKKIYVNAAKLRLLQCMKFSDEDMKWLTTNETDAHIHVVPLWSIASFKRMNYLSRHHHVCVQI